MVSTVGTGVRGGPAGPVPADAAARYDAFISYSHAADGRLAPALQRALERLGTPWYRRRGLRLFRDRTGLSTNPSLWGGITTAMDAARWFVLLASPEAAGSVWVNREVEHWKATHPPGRLLPVLTSGEWWWDESHADVDWARSTAVPPALRGVYDSEPLYLDLRWAKQAEHLDTRHSRFRDAVAELAAPLHGTTKDELESADVRQHRRAVRLAATTAATLAVLTVIAVVAGLLAVLNANTAERRRVLALSRGLSLASESLRDTQLDAALLLGVEARSLADTPEAATSLVTALHSSAGLVTILHRHVGQVVTAVAVTPDGRRAVSTGQLGLVALGPVGGDVGVQYLAGHRGVVWDVALAPDGTWAATAGEDGTVRRWDLASGTALGAAMAGHDGDVLTVAVAPGGRVIASGGADGTVRLWAAATGLPLAVLAGHSDRVTAVAFTPDGGQLVSASWDGTLRRWAPVVGEAFAGPLTAGSVRPLGQVLDAAVALDSVAVTPDGSTVLAGGSDGTVHRWAVDGASAVDRGVLAGQSGSVLALAVRPDGQAVAAAGSGRAVWTWDLTTGALVGAPLRGHDGWIEGLAYAPGGGTLVSAAFDGTLRVWDVAGVEPVSGGLTGDPGPVRGVAVADGALVSVGDWGATVRSAGTDVPPDVRTPGAQGSSALAAVAAFPDGRTFATAGYDGSVTVWRTDRSEPVVRMAGHDGIATAVAVSPDGSRVASGGRDGTVRLWDPAAGAAVGSPATGHDGTVSGVAFLPDGGTLVSVGWDGTLRRWTVGADGLSPAGPPRSGHNGAVASLAVSPDGAVIATGGFDDSVRLWPAAGGDPVGPPLTGHTHAVLALAFAPDGRQLASGGADRTIRVWATDAGATGADAAAALMLGPLSGHSGAVNALAWTADGSLLVSGGEEGTVRRWQLRAETFEARACAIANRNLTPQEWTRFVGDEPYREICPGRPLPPDVDTVGVPLRP